MSDVFSPDVRSEIMKRVKPFGNKTTELKLIEVFKQNGITGWKRHYNVKGHPDFAFVDKRIAVFVDGCFWHGHDCRNTRPTSNKEYWERKRNRNIQHDKQITERFNDRGWVVIRIWECELKNKNKELLLEKIQPLIKGKNDCT